MNDELSYVEESKREYVKKLCIKISKFMNISHNFKG